VITKLVVKDRNIHAIVVLPDSACRALDPRPLGCVGVADAAADVVFVVFGVESVVRGRFWELQADLFGYAAFASVFGHGLWI
jgi:hypothetical protein